MPIELLHLNLNKNQLAKTRKNQLFQVKANQVILSHKDSNIILSVPHSLFVYVHRQARNGKGARISDYEVYGGQGGSGVNGAFKQLGKSLKKTVYQTGDMIKSDLKQLGKEALNKTTSNLRSGLNEGLNQSSNFLNSQLNSLDTQGNKLLDGKGLKKRRVVGKGLQKDLKKLGNNALKMLKNTGKEALKEVAETGIKGGISALKSASNYVLPGSDILLENQFQNLEDKGIKAVNKKISGLGLKNSQVARESPYYHNTELLYGNEAWKLIPKTKKRVSGGSFLPF